MYELLDSTGAFTKQDLTVGLFGRCLHRVRHATLDIGSPTIYILGEDDFATINRGGGWMATLML
jgi:hypothetical protein